MRKIKTKMYVKRWITWEKAQKKKESIGGLGGYFENGMRGQKNYFDILNPEFQPYAEALRREIIKNKIIITGQEHQNGKHVPLFSDGTVGTFTYRSWGDLMAAIWSEELDTDFCYMDFYMFSMFKEKRDKITELS